MTFPGESVILDWANPIAGTDGWDDYFDLYFRRDGLSVTLNSGASFIAGFYDYQHLPSASEPVSAAVVIVTEAASAGTITVAAGTDPDWNLDNPALATQPLGSQVVSGAQTLVFPIPSFDVAAFYNYDSEAIAYVEVTAGTVEFSQIRLRLWPPGGIAGAWVPGSTATAAGGFEKIQMAPATPVGGDGPDVATAYAEAVATWDAGGPIQAYVSGSPVAQGSVELNFNGVSASAFMLLSAVSTWVGASGVGDVVYATPEATVAHPDEVPDEAGALISGPDGEPVHYGFGGWSGGTLQVLSYTSTIGGDPATPSAAGVAEMVPDADPPNVWFDSPYWYTDRFDPPSSGTAIPPATATSEPYDATPIALPSTATFRVNVASYAWYDQPLDNYTPGGGGSYVYFGSQNDILQVQDLESILTIPTHYIWDPEAMPAPIPTRVYPRGDGLGMGAPRLMDGRSPYRSERVFGTP